MSDDLGEDAQRALRADHQADEVVAGNVLDELAAELDDLAGGRDDLQAGDVTAGDAVLDGLAAAGVLGDVAADVAGLQAHRIAGEEQALVGDGLVDLVGDDARLDDDHQVRRVDLEDAVHAVAQQDDAAHDRHGPAGEPAAGAARRDGNRLAVGQLHDRGDLLGRFRPNHASGMWAYSASATSSCE